MSKKLLVIGILIAWISCMTFHCSNNTANASGLSNSPTYDEQKGYREFLKHLPQQAMKPTIKPPFYLKNDGLPRFIFDFKSYIMVQQLLSQPTPPKKQQSDVQQPIQTEAKKLVALTFDDGPNDKSTIQILNILQKYNVKATFFVLGQNVEKYANVVKMIQAQGHQIANHTWSHKNLTKLSPQEMQEQIDQTNEAIYEVTGHYPTVYRPPYGATDERVRSEIQMKAYLWSLDTLDWQHKDSAKTLANVKAKVKDGSVILMHDIHQETADALASVIQYLQKEQYEFVTMDELYN